MAFDVSTVTGYVSANEKKLIGKHTIPRPEIDLVGYKPSKNELLIVEAKSYMDSIGVDYQEIDTAYDIPDGRYKLFTCENYRNIVFNKFFLVNKIKRRCYRMITG